MPERKEESITTKKSATYREFEKIAVLVPGLLEQIKDSKELDVSAAGEKVPVLFVQFQPDVTQECIGKFLFQYFVTNATGSSSYVPEVSLEKKLNQYILAFHKV